LNTLLYAHRACRLNKPVFYEPTAIASKKGLLLECWRPLYHALGDMHGVSKATVLRVVHKTVTAINEIILPQVIKWPSDDEMVEVVVAHAWT
jgi:hypothetical protein